MEKCLLIMQLARGSIVLALGVEFGSHVAVRIRANAMRELLPGLFARPIKQCSTRGSQEIPQPSTNRAQPRLTSEF